MSDAQPSVLRLSADEWSDLQETLSTSTSRAKQRRINAYGADWVNRMDAQRIQRAKHRKRSKNARAMRRRNRR